MHTSETLRSPHFRYWRMDAGGRARAGFNSFCADYHEQDRVGVVSPRLEDGVLGAGYALLALTTAFYDAQRARAADVAANGGQGISSSTRNISRSLARTKSGWRRARGA